MTAARPRVLVVDDQTLFREGLVKLLTADPSISVVGSAVDGLDAIRAVEAERPDVVLMDLHMRRLDGIRATARVVERFPATRVLILASTQTDEAVVEAIKAGASGYVVKDSALELLVAAIHQAAQGAPVLSQDSLRAVVSAAVGAAAPARRRRLLTNRQFEILEGLCAGLSLKQVGLEIGLKEKTVRNQASLMYSRLGVHDRAQAILYALHNGLAPRNGSAPAGLH